LLIVIRGRSGHDNWISACCCVLAVLAMAAWTGPGPTVVSALLLGLTLLFLDRVEAPGGPVRWTRLLPLWALFPLWACLDSWMVFGLLVVLLRTLGAAVQGGRSPGEAGSPRARTLLLGLGGCLLAGLLQPRHVGAFELPAPLGLSPAALVLRQAPPGR